MILDSLVDFTELKYVFSENVVIDNCLSEDENNLAKKFIEKRKQEFNVGRFCAKKALRKLGLDVNQILKGESGEPLWPLEIVGSISHTNNIVVSVVGYKENYLSIGVDVECVGRIKRNMWDNLFTRKEQDYLSLYSGAELEEKTTLFFSLKESYYKMQYQLTKKKLWFDDVEIKEVGAQFLVLDKTSDQMSLFGKISLINEVQNKMVFTCVVASKN